MSCAMPLRLPRGSCVNEEADRIDAGAIPTCPGGSVYEEGPTCADAPDNSRSKSALEERTHQHRAPDGLVRSSGRTYNPELSVNGALFFSARDSG